MDVILKALAPALPDRMPAAHQGAVGAGQTFFGVDPGTGKLFLTQGSEGAGWGGRPWEDGEDAAVTVCQGDVRNAPIEATELRAPVIVERRALRPGSAGAGKFPAAWARRS